MKIIKNLIPLAVAVIIFAALNVKAYFDPTIGVFCSRDPMGEPGFETLRAANTVQSIGQAVSPVSLPPGRFFTRDPIAEKTSPNLFAFVANNPINNDDLFGLCQQNTCDQWHIDVVSMVSVDYVLGLLVVKAQLTASPKCCMDKYHADNYEYWGAGFGLGLKGTLNLALGGYDLKTQCVPWSAWNGPGRIVGIGAGVRTTYGSDWFLTPQGKFTLTGSAMGFDLSAFTTTGFWHMFPTSGPGTQQQ